MKVYIAGPMTGVEDFNHPAFNAAAEALTARGFTPLNPVDNDTEGQKATWGWYMRVALRQVADADAMCLLPGWQSSKGANLEVTIGEALKLDIRPLDEWLKVKP